MITRSTLIIAAVALALAVIAAVTPFLPPYPLPAWIVGAWTVGPFEHWWYSLPDSSRSVALYHVGTSIGAAVYPALVMAAFWFWCKPLRRGVSAFPRRTVVLALAALGLSALYFLRSWPYGLRYQGLPTLLTYIAFSCATVAMLWIGWTYARRAASWWGSLAVHFGVFAWLLVLAFPWIGELI